MSLLDDQSASRDDGAQGEVVTAGGEGSSRHSERSDTGSATAVAPRPGAPSGRSLEKAIEALALALEMRLDKHPVSAATAASSRNGDPFAGLRELATKSGIALEETEFRSGGEAYALIQQGYPVLLAPPDGKLVVLQRLEGRKIEAAIIDQQLSHETFSTSDVSRLLRDTEQSRMWFARKELECDSMGVEHDPHGGEHHDHPTPLQRFWALLNLDRRDVYLVILFAGVAGVLGLATPLVIEGLVNVVRWGTYFQPLLVLAGLLLVCLGIAGVLRVLQTWVVEIIQRRQFVRIVSDLSHRFPRANQEGLRGEYPRELANRVFDIMTIQKATAVLLLDGVSIVLTTILGLILLGFYHPFLLGFDLVLVFTMISLTWILGRGGIRTAIDESKTKYAVAHWLQDVIALPAAFKTGGGESLAVRRANQLTADYITARKRQFGVVIRQVIFAISLQVIASTALLGLGGWLVIDGTLTLGQLVASELIITVVVGAFAKAGKSLEKFYDMMAGIDKVGHLIDVQPDGKPDVAEFPPGPARVEWGDLVFKTETQRAAVVAASIEAGTKAAVVGEDQLGKMLLARSLAGLASPDEGTILVGGADALETALSDAGTLLAYAGRPEIFHGSLRENVNLGRDGISENRVREALAAAELGAMAVTLPSGLETRLQTDGYPLTYHQQLQLMIARAVASHPRVLLIDGLLDQLGKSTREEILEHLTAPDVPWTLLVFTNREDIASRLPTRVAASD